MKKKRK